VKKSEKESVVTAIRLPSKDSEWLRGRSEGITDSIKRGLELLAIEDEADEPTRELAMLVFDLARTAELETGGKWHADAGAHRMLLRSLMTALSKWRPVDCSNNLFDTVELKPLEDRPNASQPILDADELGVIAGQNTIEIPDREAREQVRAAMQRSLQELVKFQRTRGEEGND
jgi:hypothetical protein